ncbi:tRNA (guanosine(18)-2'-O)-methyltransferase TARBP1-like isoform X1 [Mytilus galloprovincialis]|uniref:tRNA (guanosine(18)-2'-O)-methyltransferase TARBP1-like isoform X1 n=2 Tax=Mytilus galloprovincialis TaxID=29158 RepID=UPI003F7BCE31
MESSQLLRQLKELTLLDLDKAVLKESEYIRDVILIKITSENRPLQEHLNILTSLVSSNKTALSENTCTVILQQICIPLLKSIHLSYDRRKENVAELGQTNKLITSCITTENEVSFKPLIDLCLQSLKNHVKVKSCTLDSQALEGVLDLQVCLDVLLNLTQRKDHATGNIYMIKSCKDTIKDIFDNLLCILSDFQNQTALNLSLRCSSNIIKNEDQKDYLSTFWQLINRMWKTNKEADILNIYLCGLSNFFFPIDNSCNINIRNEQVFWEIVQKGLNSENPLSRKQSVYLIKRNIDICEKLNLDVNSNFNGHDVPLFWWSKDKEKNLVKVWEDLVMLLETMEDRQIHVIKPLLPRLQTMIKAASSETEKPVLHTSWLCTIFRRGIAHESIALVKWMTEQVLYLDLDTCPIIEQGEHKYFASEFLHSIQDQKLYPRPKKSARGTIPICGAGLIHLFQSCWKALKTDEKRGQFYGSILETLSTSNWGPVPLMFICQAISCVPQSQILNKQALLFIRKILTTQVTNSGVFLRGAAQSFFVRTLLSLTNLSVVPPKDFAAALSIFESEDGLARGTTLWTECVNWLKVICKEQNNEEWSPTSLNQYLMTATNSLLQVSQESDFSLNETEVTSFSRLLILAVDSGVLPYTVEPGIQEPCLTEIVNTVTGVILSIPNHPYMSHHKAEKAVEVLVSLLKESGQLEEDRFCQLIRKSISDCLDSFLLFTSQMLLEKWTQISSVQSIELFVNGLTQFLQITYHKQQFDQPILKLVNSCIQILADPSLGGKVEMDTQIKKLASIGILSSVTSSLTDRQQSIHEKIFSFVYDFNCTTSFDKPVADISHKEWGKIASLFISYQWKVMEYYLSHIDVVNKPMVPILKVCQDSLSVCSGLNTIPVYSCIGYLLSKCQIPNDSSSIIEALSVSWSHVQGETRSSCFWEVFEEFINLSFQPALLQQPRDSALTDVLVKSACELMEFGGEKTGIANILMRRLCSVFKSSLQLADGFYCILSQAAIYGNIFRKQERQLHDVFSYIESLGNKCSVNELKPHTTKDIMVRAELASLICSLCPTNKTHQEFAINLLRDLIKQYRAVQLETITPGTITNSLEHRKKHRLLQIVFLLETFLVQTNFEDLWTFSWDLLHQEYQPSIRHTCEWILLRMIIKKPESVDELWKIFDKLTEKKSTVLCSMMCMVSHLGVHLPKNKQEEFYTASFQKLLPWCMANHFNTRVHAAATLVKQWKQCESLKFTEVMTSNAIVNSCMAFHKEPNNLTRNIERLGENFFFKTFNPMEDFNLETIFQTLPWLFGIPDDEWISPQQFEQIISIEDSSVPVCSAKDDLKSETPGSWRFKNPEKSGGGEEDSDLEDNVEGDVQKKIMPWKLMLPDDEVQDELEYSNKKRDDDGLVVVTSLIDKIPNLGGLCRTSEIFGVSQYVIGKMKYTDDKTFKELSVTAHKWLPIIEVYQELLPQYLTEKRQEGYTLIGVEQTANSVSLTDFTFPKKSLLVLGNEKEGIPVQLINQLDVCVEIPQQGIIRSLNVHVSGALLVWEYRRQQLINGN